jgi:hypothetical protein
MRVKTGRPVADAHAAKGFVLSDAPLSAKVATFMSAVLRGQDNATVSHGHQDLV